MLKEIFVARTTWLSHSRRHENTVSCHGDVVKMQTAYPCSQNLRGVVYACGQAIVPPFDLSLDVEERLLCVSPI